MSSTLAVVVLAVFGAACVAATFVGLPGTWVLVAVAVGVELLDTVWAGPGVVSFGWGWLAGATALALVGEGLELLSGLAGARLGGATRRGLVGALVGGLVGAVAGTGLLPVVGTLVGGAVGTFGGALLAETTGEQARTRREALVPALAATLARVLGGVAKTGVALGVLVVLLVALWR